MHAACCRRRCIYQSYERKKREEAESGNGQCSVCRDRTPSTHRHEATCQSQKIPSVATKIQHDQTRAAQLSHPSKFCPLSSSEEQARTEPEPMCRSQARSQSSPRRATGSTSDVCRARYTCAPKGMGSIGCAQPQPCKSNARKLKSAGGAAWAEAVPSGEGAAERRQRKVIQAGRSIAADTLYRSRKDYFIDHCAIEEWRVYLPARANPCVYPDPFYACQSSPRSIKHSLGPADSSSAPGYTLPPDSAPSHQPSDLPPWWFLLPFLPPSQHHRPCPRHS